MNMKAERSISSLLAFTTLMVMMGMIKLSTASMSRGPDFGIRSPFDLCVARLKSVESGNTNCWIEYYSAVHESGPNPQDWRKALATLCPVCSEVICDSSYRWSCWHYIIPDYKSTKKVILVKKAFEPFCKARTIATNPWDIASRGADDEATANPPEAI